MYAPVIGICSRPKQRQVSSEVCLLQRLSNPFQAARYHSLVIDRDHCPEELEVTAWTQDGTIMAVQHREFHNIQVRKYLR